MAASFVGPWSGFIYGWLAATFVIGWLTERFWNRLSFPLAFVIAVIGGIGIIYLVGIPWYAAMSGMGLVEAFIGSAVAFIPGDLIKAGVAAAVIIAVRRAYPLIAPRTSARSA